MPKIISQKTVCICQKYALKMFLTLIFIVLVPSCKIGSLSRRRVEREVQTKNSLRPVGQLWICGYYGTEKVSTGLQTQFEIQFSQVFSSVFV